MNRHEITSHEFDKLISRELPVLSADRLKQIESTVMADLKPVRPIASSSVYLAGFASIFVAVCIIGASILGESGWHALTTFQRAAVFAPLAATIAVLIFSIVRQMVPAAKYAYSSATIAASLFVVLLLMISVLFSRAPEHAFIQNGLPCFEIGMICAIPSAFLFIALLRRGAALSPALTGATAGGLAGLVGLAVLEIQCPNLNVYHIVVWHISVLLTCVIGGLVFSSVISFFQRDFS